MLQKAREMVGTEDIALVIILIGVAGVVMLMGPSGSDSDYEPTQFCKDVAAETEANYTSTVDDISCHCESGEGYEQRLDTPDKVANVTDINDVLVCDVTYGERTEQLTYPLLRINETKFQQYNGSINRSEIEDQVGGSGAIN